MRWQAAMIKPRPQCEADDSLFNTHTHTTRSKLGQSDTVILVDCTLACNRTQTCPRVQFLLR